MPVRMAAPVVLVPVLALAPLAASPAGAQGCDDFSTYATCPPPAGRCLLGPNPDSCAQDCSTCTAGVDDDGDCGSDEELLNQRDDDGDGLIDEDISCLNTCDPLDFDCPTTSFPAAELDLPDPIAGTVTLAARVAHWTCAGTDQELGGLELELSPDPIDPVPFCAGFQALVRLRAAGGGTIHFEGPALLVHTRRWESLERSLIGGAMGNIQAFRWLIKADLRRLTPYAQLPPALQVPCSQDQNARPHLFLYGHLDLARDASRPGDRSAYRTAVALGHAPGRLSHAEASFNPGQQLCGTVDVTRRPIARGTPEAHDDAGWFVVAPGDNFTFRADVSPLVGDFREGRIRQVPTGGSDCRRETLACESHFEPASPAGACPARIREQAARFCGQDDGSQPCPHFNLVSAAKCNTVAGDRLAFFPVGAWGPGQFPADTELSLVEGGWYCRANFEPYWYGVHTRAASSGSWLGPAVALDVIDNQAINPAGGGQWLVGACNWFNEGGANQRFVPRQFRVMYMFPSTNPDIPRLAPCQATAVIQPAAPGSCAGGDLNLSGAGSTVENCCQCGGLEYRWLKQVGASFQVVRDWLVDPAYTESPGPASDTDYRLEVRCSTSRAACGDQATVTWTVGAPPADAGPDQAICQGGGGAHLGTPASPGLGYSWTPATGLDDPALAQPLATPATTTTYTLRVERAGDPACFRQDLVEVRVDPPPAAAVTRLLAAQAADDCRFAWSPEPSAGGGYHVYRVLAGSDVPRAPQVGLRVAATAPGPGNTAADHPGAVPGPGGTLFCYQVVAVCIDGTSEGPL